jgi:hypothetical protein
MEPLKSASELDINRLAYNIDMYNLPYKLTAAFKQGLLLLS